MLLKALRCATALFLLLLFAGVPASAQSDNANVSGTITDPSGAAIPGAKVSLKNQSTGLAREATTNESGAYMIPTVPPGMYTFTVEATGFKKHESTGNKIDPSVPANISAEMQVGALSEVVEVTATASALQTESGALGRVVEGKQMQDIQLNGRNPVFLALLKPGVRGSSLSGFSYAMTTGSLVINGSRTQDNLITYDGAVAVRTRSNGTSIGSADLDMTSEVQILTAAYGAEYGRSSGGQVRVITKSGTSQFHGSAFEYFRNNKLDANSWSRNRSASTNTTAPLRYNQFGYNLSGPIFIPGKFNADRSKYFFTWGQEWARQRSTSSNWRNVPSEKMKTGNFSELLTGGNVWYSAAKTLYDPYGNHDASGNPTTPVSGNIIPTAQLSASGTGLLKVYPTANGLSGSNNWYGQASSPTNQRKDSLGIDLIPTDKDNIRVRALFYHYITVDPFGSSLLLTNKTTDRPNQTASLNWTRTLSPTFIMETLLTASRDQVYLQMEDSTAFDRTTYGINYSYVYGSSTKDRPNKLPAVSFPVYSSYTGSPYPSQSTGPIYSASTNFTKIINNHTLKFGVLLERAGQNDYDQINVNGVPGGTDNQNGRFVFLDSTKTGSLLGIANAAYGKFDTYAEIGQRSYTPYRGHMFEAFVQDEWRATSKLKLTYGVRWTVVQPYYSLWNNMAVFDSAYYSASNAVSINPTTGNPIAGTGDSYNGVTLLGDGWPDAALGRVSLAGNTDYDYLFRGASRSYSNIDWKNYQPRLGIAYQISPTSVIRAGGGAYSTRLGVSDSIFLGGNPPLQPIASIAAGNVDNPGGGSSSTFPLSVNTQSKDFPMPKAWNYNFTFEREIGFKTVVGVSYVGRRGLHGQREKNINQLQIGTLLNTTYNENYFRPYKGYGAIRQTYNDANSWYHGFQLDVTRRFSNGLSYGLAYTLSTSKDDGSAQRDVIPDAYDASYIWGYSTFDARHVAVINFIYEFPWLRNAENKLLRSTLGGWQVTGVTQFETGTPFTVQAATDWAKMGSGSGNNITYFLKYANYGSDPEYPAQFRANSGDKNYYLTVKDSSGNLLFTAPANGTMVKDKLRSYFRNPGWQNWNIGLFKTFKLGENQSVLLRAEGFNWLNHPNWSSVDSTWTSSTFGMVTSKSSERTVQLSLRYSF